MRRKTGVEGIKHLYMTYPPLDPNDTFSNAGRCAALSLFSALLCATNNKLWMLCTRKDNYVVKFYEKQSALFLRKYSDRIPDEQLLAGDVSVTGGVSGIVIEVSASLNGAVLLMAVFSGGVSGIAAATAGPSDTAHVAGGVSITARDSIRAFSGIVAVASDPP